MLTRPVAVDSPEKFISDNLTHAPSVQQSAFDNLSVKFTTPVYAIQQFDHEFMQSPRGKTLETTFEALKRGNENSEVGWTQWGINQTADMVGQALNPLSWAAGEVGGALVRPLIAVGGKLAPRLFRQPIAELMNEKMGKYFPKLIGSKEAEETLSIGLLGRKWTEAAGIGAGAMLPQSVIDNFNAETGKHDILGIAEGMGAGAALGLMIGTVPFAWGIAKANFNRMRGRAPTAEIEVGAPEQALADGRINKDTYDFWKELEQYRSTPEGRAELEARGIKARSTEYVASQGHAVDYAKNQAKFEVLSQEQITNLQSATADQLVADHIPEQHRTALSDFMVQAGVDEMRNKTNLLDGVRGYVDYVRNNLSKREEILSRADQFLEDHFKVDTFYRGYTENAGHAYKTDTTFGKGYWMSPEIEHTLHYGENTEVIKGKFNLYDVRSRKDKSLTKLHKKLILYNPLIKKKTKYGMGFNDGLLGGRKRLLKKFHKEAKKKGYQGFVRENQVMLFEKPQSGISNINETRLPLDQKEIYDVVVSRGEDLPFHVPQEVREAIRNKSESGLKNPVEELEDIKYNILPLEKNYRQSESYKRLEDLAEIWAPAKTLLDRVHLEEELNRQQAYHDFARNMLDIADSNIGKLADRSKVHNYLEQRINPVIEKSTPKAELFELSKHREVPQDADILFTEYDEKILEMNLENSGHEYELAKEKFMEFKAQEKVFNNFIKCVLGSQA